MECDELYDVVMVGYGPVGQVCAAQLGRYGYKVGVFERYLELYGQPRAGGLDDEILRSLQSLGIVDAIKEDLLHLKKYGWWNQHGESLLSFDWEGIGISGWPEHNHFYQPMLEEALDAAVRQYPNVTIHQGWEAVSIEQRGDKVFLSVAEGKPGEDGRFTLTGERKTVQGKFLIGADGANSFARERAGITLEENPFREQWLVTDFRPKQPVSYDLDNGQICDPARPHCLFQLGQTHRRWEFMVMPGEDPDEMVKPEKVWSLVSKWLSPDTADLIRSAVYTFRSVNARDWRSGRIYIAGDAAHLMPPYLGQGMCSGIRDVSNLTWKLDLVFRGVADESLLDSYTLERRPHVDIVIDKSTELGKISCTVDPEAAKQRDEFFKSGGLPPAPSMPTLTTGVINQNSCDIAGSLGPQAVIKIGERAGLADDLVGHGWQLIVLPGVVDWINPASRDIMNLLDVKILEIGSPEGVEDVDGVYTDYLHNAGLNGILVRPDYYVYGGITDEQSVGTLFADLAGQLRLLTPAVN